MLVTILETTIDRGPPYEALADITFHFLLVAGMVLCVKRRLAGRDAEGVRTSFLDASWTCHMDRTSLLVASLRLRQIFEV